MWKKSTKILKIYILALRVPGASLQAQRGDIAHVGTVHTWGSAQLETLHTWDSAHVGTLHTWDSAHVGTKKGSATMEIFQKREALRAKRSASLIAVLRIRIKNFGSGSGLQKFQIRIQIRILDSNPDPDSGFESGSKTGKNFFFFN